MSETSRDHWTEFQDGIETVLYNSKITTGAYNELVTGINERTKRKQEWTNKRIQKEGWMTASDNKVYKCRTTRNTRQIT
jgi:hypothetical protein